MARAAKNAPFRCARAQQQRLFNVSSTLKHEISANWASRIARLRSF